jgi:hypothetical protein
VTVPLTVPLLAFDVVAPAGVVVVGPAVVGGVVSLLDDGVVSLLVDAVAMVLVELEGPSGIAVTSDVPAVTLGTLAVVSGSALLVVVEAELTRFELPHAAPSSRPARSGTARARTARLGDIACDRTTGPRRSGRAC